MCCKRMVVDAPATGQGRPLGRALLLGVVSIVMLILGLTGQATAEEGISEEGVCRPLPDTRPCTESEQEPASILLSPSGRVPFGVGATVTAEPSPMPVSKPAQIYQRSPGTDTEFIPHPSPKPSDTFVVHFFWGRGCPHCEDEKVFLDEMKLRYPGMQLKDYEVWYDTGNADILSRMARSRNLKGVGVPVTLVGEEVFVGFTTQTRNELEEAIKRQAQTQGSATASRGRDTQPATGGADRRPPEREAVRQDAPPTEHPRISSERESSRPQGKAGTTVSVPLLGTLNPSELSLPFMTIAIAGIDSFNPCAFFVLFSLLGLLVHAQSRRRMFLIGTIFVFFSGVIYFLFMAAWLNLFLVMGHVRLVTGIAGGVSVAIAAVNIKEFFAFKKGLSLAIPESAKPKLFDRMRRLMRSTSLPSMLTGAAVLAIAANSYELLCTAGFPMVFTRILTLSDLPPLSYYLYLVLYNVVYVIPLSLIVIAFTITLGKRKLTEREGRVLKLVSGTMMLGLGAILLFDPALLNNVAVSALLLGVSLCISGCVIFVTKRLKRPLVT